MSEARYALSSFQAVGDRPAHPRRGFDLAEERLHLFARAPVPGPLQGRQARQHDRIRSRVGRGHTPRSEGRGVQLVIRTEDEGGVQEMFSLRVRPRPLMGFGHPVYNVRDPRAEILSEAAARLYRAGGDTALYGLAQAVERTAVALLAEYKPGRHLQTNVEFYTALLLHGLNLPTDLFTPTFAVGRVAGWTAHCFEQLALNRILRPESVYTGDTDRRWVPLEAR